MTTVISAANHEKRIIALYSIKINKSNLLRQRKSGVCFTVKRYNILTNIKN